MGSKVIAVWCWYSLGCITWNPKCWSCKSTGNSKGAYYKVITDGYIYSQEMKLSKGRFVFTTFLYLKHNILQSCLHDESNVQTSEDAFSKSWAPWMLQSLPIVLQLYCWQDQIFFLGNRVHRKTQCCGMWCTHGVYFCLCTLALRLNDFLQIKHHLWNFAAKTLLGCCVGFCGMPRKRIAAKSTISRKQILTQSLQYRRCR